MELYRPNRLPTISLFNSFPKMDGLMAYGPDFPVIHTRAASYVARVPGGADPGELPIQRPIKASANRLGGP
jgi:hypothetical protein